MFPQLVTQSNAKTGKRNTPPPGWIQKGYVHLHPGDTFSYPTALFTTDPVAFQPHFTPEQVGYSGIDTSTVDVHQWGLQLPEAMDVRLGIMKDQQARLQFYAQESFPSPMQQYIAKLVRRKRSLFHKNDSELDNKDFIIRISLGVCWRLVRVSALMTLAHFHELVLVPVMGWSRGRRGYVFRDPSDGSMFGPKHQQIGLADMSLASIHYHAIADDRAAPLGMLLRRTGSHCYYTYDLEHQFVHHLVVDSVVTSCPGVGISLLGGYGACPPEDSIGLASKGNSGFALFSAEYARNPISKISLTAVLKASHAPNYRSNWLTGLPAIFDPRAYDIDLHSLMLDATVSDHVHRRKLKKNMGNMPLRGPDNGRSTSNNSGSSGSSGSYNGSSSGGGNSTSSSNGSSSGRVRVCDRGGRIPLPGPPATTTATTTTTTTATTRSKCGACKQMVSVSAQGTAVRLR